MEHLDWFSLSIIAAISFVVMFYCYQKLQQYYSIDTYLFYASFGSVLFFGWFFLTSKVQINIWLFGVLLLAGISSWLGNYSYNLAIKKQHNLGYIEAVSSIRLAVVYLYSLVFLDASFEILKTIGVIGIVVGILSIGVDNTKPIDTKKPYEWVIWSLVSGMMFGTLIITSRFANDHGIASPIVLFFVSCVSLLLYGTGAVRKKSSFSLSLGLNILLIATAASVLGNLSLFTAYSKATNLAYPTAINNSRLILLYVLSLLGQRESWKLHKLLGIIITLVSVIILS